MHGYTWVFHSSIATHNTYHLAYLIVCNSTTTNAMDSVLARGKARDVLIFLDSAILELTVIR